MRQHPSYQSRMAMAAAELPVNSEPAAVYTPGRRYSNRACCCVAQPAVMVMMPPAGGRTAATDLLLCGHHFRASRHALAETGAAILDISGHPLTAGAWPDPA